MLSGGTAGLVSKDVLRKEQEENRRRDRNNKPLEGLSSIRLLRNSQSACSEYILPKAYRNLGCSHSFNLFC